MAFTGLGLLDTTTRIQMQAGNASSSGTFDFEMVSIGDEMHGIAISYGTTVSMTNLLTNAPTNRAIAFDPGHPAVTTAFGVTTDGHRLVFSAADPLAGVASRLIWNTFQGAFVKSVAIAGGLLNKHRQITYMRKLFWVLRNDQKIDVVNDTGAVERTINLTAAKTYVGITNDHKDLLLVRADPSEHAGGTIERWSADGVQRDKFGNPDGAFAAVYGAGMSHQRRRAVIFTSIAAPVDVV